MADKGGLSLGYRAWWSVRRAALTVFGPAQLGDADPLLRLKQEREQKVAEARSKRN